MEESHEGFFFFAPGNVDDDCMPFSSDFFMVLFTHYVRVANKNIFLTAQCTVCSRYVSSLQSS